MMNFIKRIFTIFIFILVIFSSPAKCSDLVETSGDVVLASIVGASLANIYFKSDKEGLKQYGLGFGTNIAATYTLKLSINKKRPNGKSGSFPSAHTSIAFQNATFIHKRYGFYKAIPFYLGSVYVTFSRVESKNHYVEDVIAGGILGGIVSYFITSKYKNVSLSPIITNKI
ncbi:phosphatase PAP2 family protein [Deferribacter thermophilus]|uniref:phosphatase PAP2 family protein n=1 Tax=Deferribacter thermophilus TaxID=53573 RepID=UPI003C22C90D